MALVALSVYDIKHPENEHVTTAVASLNALTRDGLRLGGIFHGGVEVYGEEWSFGYCERGTGVYRCAPRANPVYAYRESVPLGVTALSPARVAATVATMRAAWAGDSYDVLGRNCNHFCEALCEALGCEGPPKWLNSFAKNAHGVRGGLEFAREATERAMRDARDGISDAWTWLSTAVSASSVEGGGASGGDVGADGVVDGPTATRVGSDDDDARAGAGAARGAVDAGDASDAVDAMTTRE